MLPLSAVRGLAGGWRPRAIGLADVPVLWIGLGLESLVPIRFLLSPLGLGRRVLPVTELALGLVGAPVVPWLPLQFEAEDLESVLLLEKSLGDAKGAEELVDEELAVRHELGVLVLADDAIDPADGHPELAGACMAVDVAVLPEVADTVEEILLRSLGGGEFEEGSIGEMVFGPDGEGVGVPHHLDPECVGPMFRLPANREKAPEVWLRCHRRGGLGRFPGFRCIHMPPWAIFGCGQVVG